MMITILVPIYNFDVTALVSEIQGQAEGAGMPYEIIVADDKSDESYRKINRSISHLQNVSYLELEQNIGRSKIRNKLADLSKYDNLLFIDCDSQVPSPDYIKNYITYFNKKGAVVYGGRVYGDNPENDEFFLHWYYGKIREEIDAETRSAQPNCSFMTNNFLIHKELFNSIRFNEFIRRYGHEDTLFGFELKRNKSTVVHIDNPLVHIGLEKKDDFIRKIQASLNNLKLIVNQNSYMKELSRDITVLRYYNILKKLRVRFLVRILFNIMKPTIIKNLCGKSPKLYYLDFFKLGYLTSVMMKK